jgi:hypothetical protein
MVGIRSPDGLVVGSCTSNPGDLGSRRRFRKKDARDATETDIKPHPYLNAAGTDGGLYLLGGGTDGEADRRQRLHLSVRFENRVREMPDSVTQVIAALMKVNVSISF